MGDLEMRGPRWLAARARRLEPLEKLVSVAVLAFVIIGLTLIADGLYMRAKGALAQVLLERAFDRALAGELQPKPWSWADTWPVARIQVPRLDRASVVLAGASGEAVAFGPGLLAQAARPGEPGTTIIAAHRDTHFAYLKDLRDDDAIRVTGTDGRVHTYRVTGFRVVTWDRPGIDLGAPGTHLVLVTCWPFDARLPGPYRYLVEAQLVAPAHQIVM
jgi:sortase A